MANIVQLKRSSVSGRIPDASNVSIGEPVINLADRIIFTKSGTGNVIIIGAGTTSNISEGTNLYFTNTRAISAFTSGSGIDISSNGLISAEITSSYFQSIGGNVVPSIDSAYNLGSPTHRWKTLYLANNTIDLGGALISSDGTGAIQISANGAVLPPNSRVDIGNFQKEIATISGKGATQRIVPFYTRDTGLNSVAKLFEFSVNNDFYVFKSFTLANGSSVAETNTTLFKF